ncbi:MAG: efflux RND transporter permease subunit [Phycisphaeraceae bacterium]|nr:efflux RND transporter permease subunit [Phycisphaeraceae bacterium]
MNEHPPDRRTSSLDAILSFCLEQKLIIILLVLLIGAGGVLVAPFDWKIDWLPRQPIPVDAIPNLGENQQIVFTEWPGRSPQDIQDQVTFPLTVALMGVPGVKEVRSRSMFGFSSIFVIFDEGIEFYWSRARILEKLSSLQAGVLPEGVQPTLGPDATALGQVYWYTLEGRDPDGHPIGGWDLDELRSIQDWIVRFGLLAAEGVAEVASVGGFVREYQVDIDPDALRAYRLTISDVNAAIADSNLDVGAGVTEINDVEYVVRGVGFVRRIEDLNSAVVGTGPGNIPVQVRDVARVQLGPAGRRGALTQNGAEAVGGVVVVREGYNPLAAINNVRDQVRVIEPGLPSRIIIDWTRTTPEQVRAFAREHGFEAYRSADSPELNQEAWLAWLQREDHPREIWPEWINVSKLHIVPFYDRTGLIHETLGTLSDALIQQILITIIVVLIMVFHFRVSLIISATLPMAVLLCFLFMKWFRVDSNVVSLAGIAIAIGTIVDMGIIVTENILRHLRAADRAEPRLPIVLRATREVGSAIVTAIATTVISFMAVFTMTGPEGKMFVPLAYTKTFVLIGAAMVTLTVIPALTHLLVAGRVRPGQGRRLLRFGLGVLGIAATVIGVEMGWGVVWIAGLAVVGLVVIQLLWEPMSAAIRRRANDGGGLSSRFVPFLERIDMVVERVRRGGRMAGRGARLVPWLATVLAVLATGWLLTGLWEPLGPERGLGRNLIFVFGLIVGLLGTFYIFQYFYASILRLCLAHKAAFLCIPAFLVVFGLTVWLGAERVFAFVPHAAQRMGIEPETIRQSDPWVWAVHEFPGLGREFMPPLNEGSFLWMPTTTPHASIGQALDILKFQDMAIAGVPEVEQVVGKIGRVESALDPAPVSMIETLINYRSEYKTDAAGRRLSFKFAHERGEFVRNEDGQLIPDRSRHGRPYRQWRDHIRSPRDIWNELSSAADIPGSTGAPPLQPIETRQIMLQTGMRASMGVKVRAPDLPTLDRVMLDMEAHIRQVPGIDAGSVNADRVVGKPYLEIQIDRDAIARHGLRVAEVQRIISTAIGGQALTTTVEGRERYPVRVRLPRELRDDIDAIERVLVPTRAGAQIPLGELAAVEFTRGPQMIYTEDTYLTGFVTFGQQPGLAEVEMVERVGDYLDHLVETGALTVPEGVSWRFAGTYEHQISAARTLRLVLPVSLALIFLILYFQFRSVSTTLIVFSGIAVAWAGGFTMIYFYGQPWFANFDIFGVNMRDLFQLHAINLSVAVWVGFLALFGIATDDGVVIATYLRQSFDRRRPTTIAELREATIAAGLRRVRPCLMTSATTILALLPVLTATGRGAEIMIPMAIPSVGGMSMVLLTMFTVPVLYCLVQEFRLKRGFDQSGEPVPAASGDD